jgi:hypothetical protein
LGAVLKEKKKYKKKGEKLLKKRNTIFQLQSAILHLKGRVYEALDNRSLASECYKLALRTDVHCYDAFQALVQHQMLTSWEGKSFPPV